MNLLFSVTKDDFEMQTFRSGGKGGQNQNKVNSGVRLIHRGSGARGEARDSRYQAENKRAAFDRLLKTPEWIAWHKLETARRLGSIQKVEAAVEEAMRPENIRIEGKTKEGWKELSESMERNRAPSEGPDN
jgi:protein subunit release factor B